MIKRLMANWFLLTVMLGSLLAILPAATTLVPVQPVAAETIECADGSVRDVAEADSDNPEALCAAAGGVKDGARVRASAGPPARCDTGYKFLGIIPTWYAYFGDDYGEVTSKNPLIPTTCGIVSGNVTDHILQIGLAVVDILLRVGALVSVAFMIMGGYRYISSQGEPKNIEGAMATIVNSAIGLGVTVTATVLVSFIGHSLGG